MRINMGKTVIAILSSGRGIRWVVPVLVLSGIDWDTSPLTAGLVLFKLAAQIRLTCRYRRSQATTCWPLFILLRCGSIFGHRECMNHHSLHLCESLEGL